MKQLVTFFLLFIFSFQLQAIVTSEIESTENSINKIEYLTTVDDKCFELIHGTCPPEFEIVQLNLEDSLDLGTNDKSIYTNAAVSKKLVEWLTNQLKEHKGKGSKHQRDKDSTFKRDKKYCVFVKHKDHDFWSIPTEGRVCRDSMGECLKTSMLMHYLSKSDWTAKCMLSY